MLPTVSPFSLSACPSQLLWAVAEAAYPAPLPASECLSTPQEVHITCRPAPGEALPPSLATCKGDSGCLLLWCLVTAAHQGEASMSAG